MNEEDIVLKVNDIKKIASLMNYSIQEFADHLGVSRTYLSLANSGKEKLSKKLKAQIIGAFVSHVLENGIADDNGFYDTLFYLKLKTLLSEPERSEKFKKALINYVDNSTSLKYMRYKRVLYQHLSEMSCEDKLSDAFLDQFFSMFTAEDFHYLSRKAAIYQIEHKIDFKHKEYIAKKNKIYIKNKEQE